MTTDKPIEIPLSKTKLILSFLGSLAFVAAGIWFLISPSRISNPFLNNPTLISVVGMVSVVFFGFIAIGIFRKLFDKKSGLVINSQGVIDNSSGVSAGLITWGDIQEIEILQVMNQKFLMFIVENPQNYLDRVKNPIKRNIMKMNYKTYGSPISISSKALKTDFEELNKLLIEKMNHYKS